MKKFIIPLLAALIITTGATATATTSNCTEGLENAIKEDVTKLKLCPLSSSIVKCETNYKDEVWTAGAVNLSVMGNYHCQTEEEAAEEATAPAPEVELIPDYNQM